MHCQCTAAATHSVFLGSIINFLTQVDKGPGERSNHTKSLLIRRRETDFYLWEEVPVLDRGYLVQMKDLPGLPQSYLHPDAS